MSQPEKPTEQVYLSRPSVMPALAAAGLAATVIGLYAWWPYSLLGAVTFLYTLARWLGENRREIARMPDRQHTDTAPIPLSVPIYDE